MGPSHVDNALTHRFELHVGRQARAPYINHHGLQPKQLQIQGAQQTPLGAQLGSEAQWPGHRLGVPSTGPPLNLFLQFESCLTK